MPNHQTLSQRQKISRVLNAAAKDTSGKIAMHSVREATSPSLFNRLMGTGSAFDRLMGERRYPASTVR